MSKFTNNNDFGLAMAVWLAHDEYTNGADEFPGENVISATKLLKPTRQTVLEARLEPSQNVPDVADRIASQLGHAIHDSIERAWTHGYAQSMKALGYPQKVIDKVRINPKTVEPDTIPVYLEQRAFRRFKIDNHSIVISGKFDQVINGEINDTKSTSVFTYLSGSSDEKHRLQGSLYRWLNPTLVTSPIMRINYAFTDWSRMMMRSNPDYPRHRLAQRTLQLLSEAEVERWIEAKLREIIKNQTLEERDVVRCSEEELWRSDPVWKYYPDAAKAAAGGRATKNFSTAAEAYSYRTTEKKGQGVVIEVPGKVKACGYCPVFEICSQKDEYELHD